MKGRLSKLVSPSVAVVLFSALLILSPPGATAAVPDAFSGQDGRIAFVSDRSGTLEIYSMRADGSDLRQLTHTPVGHVSQSPNWSSDGRLITFDSDRSGLGQIYVMRANGSGVRQLTHSIKHGNANPAFSPDGTQIVFERCYSIGCQIWLMNADGSHQVELTHDRNRNVQPVFSPDGSQIAFTGLVLNHFGGFKKIGIETMATDGSGLRRITPLSLQAFFPDYSPDGRRIIFASNLLVPHTSLFTVRPDGRDIRQLTDPPSNQNDGPPCYSPLGDRVAFTSDRSGSLDIWVMKSDGSGLHDVTPNTPNSIDVTPAWGPKVRP